MILDLDPVRLAPQIVPDELNWAILGWTAPTGTRSLKRNGWAISALQSIEAQFFNKTGLFK